MRMKKIAPVLFLVGMTVLLLLLGSCAFPAQAAEERIIQEASFTLPGSGEDAAAGTDTTGFLVGEFTESNGTLARFNGFGDVTIIRSNGKSSTGSYDMTEYGSREAVVNITIDGSRSSYSFDLTSGSGDFTLTDESGNVYGFTPVEY